MNEQAILQQNEARKQATLEEAILKHRAAEIALLVVEEAEQRARSAVVAAALKITGEAWDGRRRGMSPPGTARAIADAVDRLKADGRLPK